MGILIGNPIQGVQQLVAHKPVAPGVALVDLFFFLGGVLVLHNALELTVGAALNVADPIGVLHQGANEGDGVALAFVQSVGTVNGRLVQQRAVAVQNQNIVSPVALNKISGAHHRVAGAQLGLLQGGLNGWIQISQVVLHLRMPVAGDHADGRTPGALYGRNHIVDHGLHQHLAHHFGAVRLHPGAFAPG